MGRRPPKTKTGYGLRTAVELRMLQALLALDQEGPLELVPTFLGAHAIAPEFKDCPDEYTELVCNTMLPILKDWWPHQAPFHEMPFVDVFLRDGSIQSGAVAPDPAESQLSGVPA